MNKSKKETCDEYEKSSLLIFILMMSANALNYFFQVIMGRLLPNVNVYGELNTIFSLFTICSIPTVALTLCISQYIATHRDSLAKQRMFVKWICKVVFLIATGILIVGVLVSSKLSSFLSMRQELLIYTFFVVFMSIFTSVFLGILQGEKFFLQYGIMNLIFPVAKLLLGCTLVLFGYTLEAIIFSMFVGYAVMIAVGLLWCKKYVSLRVGKYTECKQSLKYVLQSLLINLGLVYFTNIDILWVKHYFSENEAGLYSSATVFAKMISYVSNALIVALFPMVAEKIDDMGKTKKILKKSFLYGTAISAFLSAFLILFAEKILIIVGKGYVDASVFFFPLSLTMITLSMVNICTNYLLALKRNMFVIFTFGIYILFQTIMVMVFHYSINWIIFEICIGLSLILLHEIVYIFYIWKKAEGEKEH